MGQRRYGDTGYQSYLVDTDPILWCLYIGWLRDGCSRIAWDCFITLEITVATAGLYLAYRFTLLLSSSLINSTSAEKIAASRGSSKA